jgi:enterobacterial common antigen flippase
VKVLAILLGPVGVGIAGIYQTIASIVSSATGLGLSYSGVREIAAAAATKDDIKISKATTILKSWTLATGVIGMAVTIIFCRPLSRLSFGNESYATGVALMSVGVLLTALTGGRTAMMQGFRRINSIAKANISGAFIGLIGAVFIYYAWRIKGVVPALLFTFFATQAATWYFSRQITIKKSKLTLRTTYKQGFPMARLGFFMVVTILMNNGFMYLVRAFIIQKSSLESVGHFIAAWTISTMYISAIFGAMGADYFPRLSGLLHDEAAMTRLVNDQTEIALLLTAPIIIGMVSFIRIIVNIFYSKAFGVTAEILSWQLLGDFIKVLGYPLGYVLIAKAKGKLVIATELFWNILYFGMIFFGWKVFGIKSSGIAFLIAYVANVACVFFLVRKAIGFGWSKNVLQYFLFFALLLFFAFLNSVASEGKLQQYIFGILLTVSAALFSFLELRKVVNIQRVIEKLKAQLVALRG